MTRLIVVGAAGRMGRAVLEAARAAGDLDIVAALEHPDHPQLGHEVLPGLKLTSDREAAVASGEVAIDFSLPSSTADFAELAAARGLPLAIATTGLEPSQRDRIGAAAERTPIVLAANYSIGVSVLMQLVEEAARMLPDYEVDILETHHDQKVDAPSGTALALGRIVAGARGQKFDDVAVYQREGHTGVRDPRAIGMQALRLGDSPGEHTVFLAGPGERIELTSRSLSRANFAAGAIRAARWVVGKTPGLYGMHDVIA
jgi:4-hydroxy-tetrahydrodipicolinate reductase